jgi:hypothetical protein
MRVVPRLWSIERFLSRHRRATALVGVLLVLGTAALNTHEALPEHHHQVGEATVCIAALSIAVLAALGWGTRRSTGAVTCRIGMAVVRLERGHVTAIPAAIARAGPPGPAVLRL